jgi:hypothetical protein
VHWFVHEDLAGGVGSTKSAGDGNAGGAASVAEHKAKFPMAKFPMAPGKANFPPFLHW